MLRACCTFSFISGAQHVMKEYCVFFLSKRKSTLFFSCYCCCCLPTLHSNNNNNNYYDSSAQTLTHTRTVSWARHADMRMAIYEASSASDKYSSSDSGDQAQYLAHSDVKNLFWNCIRLFFIKYLRLLAILINWFQSLIILFIILNYLNYFLFYSIRLLWLFFSLSISLFLSFSHIRRRKKKLSAWRSNGVRFGFICSFYWLDCRGMWNMNAFFRFIEVIATIMRCLAVKSYKISFHKFLFNFEEHFLAFLWTKRVKPLNKKQ